MSHHPVEDFSAPRDPEAFRQAAARVAANLRAAESVLVHCAGGVGRAGMFAVGVLCELGLGREEAADRVKHADSEPENDCQRRCLERLWP